MSSVAVRIIEQPGLVWKEGLFSSEPCWTKEPSLEVIEKLVIKHLCLPNGESPNISFFAEGALNKLYAIDCTKGQFIFRATLPVAPGVKTKSEVATVAFVRAKTNISVPHIFAYDSDSRNELGFEWMLMERVDARPLHQVWHQMSWLKKGLLVMQVADFMAQLFRTEMSSIGSLYLVNEDNNSNTATDTSVELQVGETVLPPFFKGTAITLSTDRGPYGTSSAYITARIAFAQHFASQLNLDDEDDLEHYKDIQAVLSGIEKLLPDLFPPEKTECTMLCNRDMSMSNILVTDAGDLVSIVDWECCALLPKALSTQLPHFLKGPCQNVFPELPEDLSNEFYLESLERYEKTRLREFFLEEIGRLEPQWTHIYMTEQKKQDVLVAIEYCENDMLVKWARGWIDALLEGREAKRSLGDVGNV